MAQNLCVLICEAFEREANTVIEQEGFDNVSIITYPTSMFHIRTRWDGVMQKIEANKSRCRIMLLGGGCIVGLEAPPDELKENCYYQQLNKCFDMFINKSLINLYVKQGAYLITPSWVRNWRERMEEYHFDKEKAEQFFQRSKTKLILLDTGVYHDIEGFLKEFSEFVGLPYEILPIGLDFFRLFLKESILEWQLKEGDAFKKVGALLEAFKIDAKPSIQIEEEKQQVILLEVWWNDKLGPYLKNHYPVDVQLKIPIEKLGFQLFSGVESIYGQDKLLGAGGILLDVENIQRQAYIFFDAINDPSARGRQRPFMLSVIAPKINYFESLKIKEIFKDLSGKVKKAKIKDELDLIKYWDRIAQILATPVI